MQPFHALSNRPTIDSSVHHNFLNHGQCLCGVGFIKEQNRVNILVLICAGHFFCLVNFELDIFVCCTTMNLEKKMMYDESVITVCVIQSQQKGVYTTF